MLALDSASGSEVSTLAATLSTLDSGLLIEEVNRDFTIQDQGTVLDSPAAPWATADGGVGLDTAMVANVVFGQDYGYGVPPEFTSLGSDLIALDTSTGQELISRGLHALDTGSGGDGFGKSLTYLDPGTGTDEAWIGFVIEDDGLAQDQVAGTGRVALDLGVGSTLVLSPATTLLALDPGTGFEQVTLNATLNPVQEQGLAADLGLVTLALQVQDQGSSQDAITDRIVTAFEQAGSTSQAQIPTRATLVLDPGTGFEQVSLVAQLGPVQEQGTGSALVSTSQAVLVQDAALSQDILSGRILERADHAQGAGSALADAASPSVPTELARAFEQVSVQALLPAVQEQGTGFEQVSVTQAVLVQDSALAHDVLTSRALDRADYAEGTDSALVSAAGLQGLEQARAFEQVSVQAFLPAVQEQGTAQEQGTSTLASLALEQGLGQEHIDLAREVRDFASGTEQWGQSLAIQDQGLGQEQGNVPLPREDSALGVDQARVNQVAFDQGRGEDRLGSQVSAVSVQALDVGVGTAGAPGRAVQADVPAALDLGLALAAAVVDARLVAPDAALGVEVMDSLVGQDRVVADAGRGHEQVSLAVDDLLAREVAFSRENALGAPRGTLTLTNRWPAVPAG